MPNIRAFNGLRYNPDKIRDFRKVLAPPYDVISQKEQDALYQSDAHNVIRLELGKDLPGDTKSANKYTRARDYLLKWISQKVLIQDQKPCLYVYRQTYFEKGKKKTRLGFIAAMKVNEKLVLKHENTLAAPKVDRLNLLKETQTNLSPIWGLYEDKSKAIFRLLSQSARQKPIIDVTLDGVRHELFGQCDPAVIRRIQQAMGPKPMFIADGHHRFETACNYSRLVKKQRGRLRDAVMTYFSDCTNNPLTIYPTHRLISIDRPVDVLTRLSQLGRLENALGLNQILRFLDSHRGRIKNAGYDFGVFFKKQYYLFHLSAELTGKVDAKNPIARLDVSVLHRFLIAPVFGIKKIEKSKQIDFTRDPKVAVEKVKSGEFKIAFFLRPTSLPEMLEASKKGIRMPQKSTYFYPKLLSGLVFHRFQNAGDPN